MRSVDFYACTGILIAGSSLLVSLRYLLNLQSLDAILAPASFGGLGLHLILAYATGHLVAALGNLLEDRYWKFWNGMPTDWAITHPNDSRFKGAAEAVSRFCDHAGGITDLRE